MLYNRFFGANGPDLGLAFRLSVIQKKYNPLNLF